MVYVVSLIFLVISIFVIWYLVSSERGPKEPAKGLWAAFGFGILSIVIIDYLSIYGGPESLENANMLSIFLTSMGTGIIEESSKFIPLALFIYKKKYFTEHSDGIIYFAIVGLTFGFVENFLYTMNFGANVGIGRLLLIPIFHGATTGIIGYFLARQKVSGGSIMKTVLVLLLVAIMHGIYNFGLSIEVGFFNILSLMLTLLITAGFFLFYSESKRKDALQGLSGQGSNRYCKYCGRQNLKRSLYCEYCGKRL